MSMLTVMVLSVAETRIDDTRYNISQGPADEVLLPV